MFDYDAFETAGHKLTLVQGLTAGISTYYCESCGALVKVGGPTSGLVLFHVVPGTLSTERKCVPVGRVGDSPPDLSPASLKEKLQKLADEDMERLRRI
jgi:hypothetical protein